MIYSWDTEAVISNESGTGWTLDVTAANLAPDLDEKDFVVAFDGVLVDTSQFVKTSQSTVRYDGPATSGVSVELRRNTSIAPFRLVNYSDVILSGDYSRNLERYSRLFAEQRAFGGAEVGTVTINDAAYGAGWAGDTINGASRASLYAKIEDVIDDYEAADTALQASLSAAINLRAPLASPNFTGIPTAPTAAAATNNTQIATTQYVTAGIGNALVSVNADIALRAPIDSPTLTGTPTAPTAAASTDTTQIATTAFVQSVVDDAPRRVVRHVFDGSTSEITFNFSDLGFPNPTSLLWRFGLTGPLSGNPLFFMRLNGISANSAYPGRFIFSAAAGGSVASGDSNGALTNSAYVIEAVGSTGAVMTALSADGQITRSGGRLMCHHTSLRTVTAEALSVVIRSATVETASLSTLTFGGYSIDSAALLAIPAGSFLDIHVLA